MNAILSELLILRKASRAHKNAGIGFALVSPALRAGAEASSRMSVPVNKIAGAVHSCLGACYASPTPLRTCCQYLDGLRREKWREDEVEQVEKAVLRLLSALIITQSDSHHVEDWREDRNDKVCEVSAPAHNGH
jgi:hypothetical protein